MWSISEDVSDVLSHMVGDRSEKCVLNDFALLRKALEPTALLTNRQVMWVTMIHRRHEGKGAFSIKI